MITRRIKNARKSCDQIKVILSTFPERYYPEEINEMLKILHRIKRTTWRGKNNHA